ncbi:hypothetical protein Q8A67_007282 [Cirrhinus molitorella]|uniref:Uncharacterized protein n=1 Tax=Cirrhinus molitorella TaxID=172907 RepID=A0AA88Q092_9TELE|nr:hypothetical protein Q8A67_007282 [Cirrhinus molitorella]
MGDQGHIENFDQNKSSGVEHKGTSLFIVSCGAQTHVESIMNDTSGDEDYFPGCSPVQQKRSEPEPSCVSIKSDR